MKKVIGYKRIVLFSIVLLMLFSFSSCKQENSNNEDVVAIENLMHYFDDPHNLSINVLKKYVVSDREIIYYVEWVYPEKNDNNAYELLLVYDPGTQKANLRHFSDMEYGLYADVKQKWDEIQNSPDVVFSKEEILDIKQSAMDNIS